MIFLGDLFGGLFPGALSPSGACRFFRDPPSPEKGPRVSCETNNNNKKRHQRKTKKQNDEPHLRLVALMKMAQYRPGMPRANLHHRNPRLNLRGLPRCDVACTAHRNRKSCCAARRTHIRNALRTLETTRSACNAAQRCALQNKC